MKKPEINREKVMELLRASKVFIIECLILCAVIAAVSVYIYFRYPGFIDNFSSPSAFNAFMKAHAGESYAVYIGLQALQVIISVIPGQVVQIAGGYLYGFWLSSLLSLIGIAIGSAAGFYIARLLGKGAVRLLAGEKALDQASELLDSDASYRILFFLYLIPGFPKDVLCYVAGLSKMSFWSFILMATLVRFPAMAGSMLIGSLIGRQAYIASAVIAAVCIALFILCVVFRKRILGAIDRYFAATGTKR